MGGAGGGDDDVGIHRPFHKLFERNSLTVELLGQIFRPAMVPVGNKDGLDTVLHQMTRG